MGLLQVAAMGQANRLMSYSERRLVDFSLDTANVCVSDSWVVKGILSVTGV